MNKSSLNNEVDPLTFINNYFYGSGNFTVADGPCSEKYNKNSGSLHEWLEVCELQKTVTPMWIIAAGVKFGFIVKAVKKTSNGEIDNMLCGRSNKTQIFVDSLIQYIYDTKAEIGIVEQI